MATTTITKTETAGRQAHPPARRSSADHGHGDLRRRHQDAGHALRGDSAQSARRREDPFDRCQQSQGAPGRRCGVHRCKDTKNVGAVPCGASLPGLARPASSHAGDGSRVFRRPSRGSRGCNGPLHRARRRGSDRSRLRTGSTPWPIPRRRSRQARPRCIRSGRITRRSHFTRKAARSTRPSPKPT